MTCKNCFEEIPEGSMFCPLCGAKAEELTPYEAPLEQTADPADVFCGNCGHRQEPGAQFCANCGKTLAPPALKSGLSGLAKIKGKKSLITIIGIAAGAVAAIAIIVGIVSAILSGFGPEAAAEKFMDAFMAGKSKAIVNMIHPDMLEAFYDRADMDEDELIDELDEEFEDIEDELEDCSWEIKRVKEYGKEDDEYEDIEDVYDTYDVEVKISGVAKARVSLEIDGEKNIAELWFVKIGTEWYYYIPSMSLFYYF